MPAAQLRPFHIVEWVDSRTTWGANQKRGAIVAVQRPFSWAAKLGYIDRNPVSGVEKPKPVRREQYVTPDQFGQLLDRYQEDDPFRDLLQFLWETGCRPQEARHVEPRHYNPAFARFDIPPAEAKGKKRWRVRLAVYGSTEPGILPESRSARRTAGRTRRRGPCIVVNGLGGVCVWLAQRLHRIPTGKPQFVDWNSLHEQFGQGFGGESAEVFASACR